MAFFEHPPPAPEPAERVDGDASEELARLLNLSPDSFLEALGGEWEEITAVDGARRFIAGTPLQVMVEVDYDVVRVAQPEMVWPNNLMSEVVAGRIHLETRYPSPDELSAAATSAAKAQRRRFRWCRYCRTLTEPGYMNQSRICMGCASTYLGVVY